MSTTEKYVHSLKQIKEAEETTQREIDEQKKKVAEEFKNFETNVAKTIVTAKTDGEKLVETSIEQARKKAIVETEKIVEDAKNISQTNSTKINAQTGREVIDMLLKEV